MIERTDIVRAARKYLGTPFHHQGRLRGIGVDCVGLLVGVAQDCGIEHVDSMAYNKRPDGKTLQREIEKSCTRIPLTEAMIGDILLFRFLGEATHVGIMSDKGMIHTYQGVGRVVEHGLRPPWTNRLCGAYRFKGVA